MVLHEAGRSDEAVVRLDDAAAQWTGLGRRSRAGQARWDCAVVLDALGRDREAEQRRDEAAADGVVGPPDPATG